MRQAVLRTNSPPHDCAAGLRKHAADNGLEAFRHIFLGEDDDWCSHDGKEIGSPVAEDTK